MTETYGWLPWVSERLIRRATSVLPPHHRDRYEEEWLAELDHLPTRGVASILFAIRILVRARSTRRALELAREAPGLKRIFDVAASAGALLMCAPLLSGLALAVKVGSPGPVFFRAARVGRNGRLIGLLKLRTMVLADPTRESRLTGLGRFLRWSCLDELPQFVSVLSGDMALVGPRPRRLGEPVPEHLVEFAGRLKPGIVCWTTLAEVGGRLSLQEAHHRDVAHFTNWTLAGEFRLLLATVTVVLSTDGRR